MANFLPNNNAGLLQPPVNAQPQGLLAKPRTTYESLERFIPPELRGLIPSWQGVGDAVRTGLEIFGPQADVHAMKTSAANTMRSLLDPDKSTPDKIREGLLGSAYTAAAIPMMAFPGTIAWHGTPHRWAAEPGYPHGRPRLDKMGTGEGMHGYGRGFYVADAPKGAKTYQSKVAALQDGQRPTIDGKPINWNDPVETAAFELARHNGNRAAAADFHATTFRGGANNPAVQILRSDQKLPDVTLPGHLYKHDIPDADTAKYLDYDAPLDAQPQVVKDALKKEGFWPDGDTDRIRGGDIFFRMDASGGAEETLRKHGVPGLRVIDEGSRGKKEGITHNYVTWDQDVLNRTKMLEIDDQPVGLLGN